MLGNAGIGKKAGIEGKDFGGVVAGVEAGDEARNALDDQRIGVDAEIAFAIAKFGNEPEVGKASLDAIGFGLEFGGERFVLFGEVHDVEQAILRGGQDLEVFEEFFFLLGESCHAGGTIPCRERSAKFACGCGWITRILAYPCNRSGPVLGIDVGGTKIAAGVIRFPSGQILVQKTIPTEPTRGGELALANVVGLARELAGNAGASAVGVGLCELVGTDGEILSSNCLGWKSDEVRKRLGDWGPVWIEADVRAAALAEAMFGAGRPFRIFLFVTVGTGISSCLVMDGKPYLGARGATGTMASSPLAIPCEKCGEVNARTLEEIAAGPALAARYNKVRPGTARSGQDVFRASEQGDEVAREVIASAGQALESSVAMLINVLDPEAVIVGGGLGLSEGGYWESFLEATRRHIWSDVHRGLPILRAETGPGAGDVGRGGVRLESNEGADFEMNFL